MEFEATPLDDVEIRVKTFHLRLQQPEFKLDRQEFFKIGVAVSHESAWPA
jgi:hypothetical protein